MAMFFETRRTLVYLLGHVQPIANSHNSSYCQYFCVLNSLIVVGITWRNELPIFFVLGLIQIERGTVNSQVGCAHGVFSVCRLN